MADVDVHSVTIPFHAKKLSLSGRPLKKTERGEGERKKGGGAEKPLLAKRRDSEILLARICKKFGKVF